VEQPRQLGLFTEFLVVTVVNSFAATTIFAIVSASPEREAAHHNAIDPVRSSNGRSLWVPFHAMTRFSFVGFGALLAYAAG
jgi:hypothetical protein